MNASRLVYLYAILIAIGGIMGYIKAASMASLLFGGGAALLLALSAYALSSRWILGYIGACLITVLLAVFFAVRFINSDFTAWMPAGVMTVLSVGVLLGLLLFRKQCCNSSCRCD